MINNDIDIKKLKEIKYYEKYLILYPFYDFSLVSFIILNIYFYLWACDPLIMLKDKTRKVHESNREMKKHIGI